MVIFFIFNMYLFIVKLILYSFLNVIVTGCFGIFDIGFSIFLGSGRKFLKICFFFMVGNMIFLFDFIVSRGGKVDRDE